MSNNFCLQLFVRISSIALLVLISSSLSAGTITGKAIDHIGKEVFLLRYQDPYSLKTEIIESATIGVDGTFKLTNPSESTEECVISIMNLRARIFMKKGTDYHVTFPQLTENIPFTFKPIWLEFDFTGMNDDDPNLAIAAFNRSYEQFFDSIAVDLAQKMYKGSNTYRTARKRQLESVDMAMSSSDTIVSSHGDVWKKYDEWKHVADSIKNENADLFTKTYLSYATNRIELYLGKPRKTLVQEEINSYRFDPLHPECASFLEETFAHYFNKDYFQSDFDSLDLAIREMNLTSVQGLVRSYSGVESAESIDLLILSNLRGLYYGDRYSRGLIYRNIELLSKSGHGVSSDVAKRVLEKLAAGKKGSQPEDFTLLNEKDERVKLSDFEGQFVYLNFFKSNCTSCLREMQLLEGLERKFPQQLAIVSISMDEDYEDFTKYLAHHPDQQWTFLYGGADPLLADKFNLRSLPGFYLLNPNGQLVYTYTKSPSEGVGDQLTMLLKSFKPDQRIKVWDD